LRGVFFAATVLYFSLSETSVGNIIRHRIIMLLVLLPLASQGGLSLWSCLRSMRTARTQRSLVTSPSPG
jgi:hypothetical protein